MLDSHICILMIQDLLKQYILDTWLISSLARVYPRLFVFLGIEPSVPRSQGRNDVLYFKYGESKILKIPTIIRRQTIKSQIEL